MSDYLKFARLPIIFLFLFMIGRLVLGASGVPYRAGTSVFSMP